MSDSSVSAEIDPLTRLAIKHGTDKWGPHFYTPLYHRLFAPLRDRPIRLLEIGTGGYDLVTAGGASLAMWAEYFANGQITGIDIAEKCLTLDPRIKLFRGSQTDEAFLQTVCDERGPFDIIIDDGSHVGEHVAISFQALFPALTDGGLYLIEDLQTAFWPRFGGSPADGGAAGKLVQTLIQCLNHAEIAVVDRSHPFPPFAGQVRALRAFHNLLVIEKGDNSEPSNFGYDLKNPYAAAAAASIERELESAPTAAGLANLVDLYRLGGDLVRAKAIADRASQRWPANATVLMAAYVLTLRQKDTPATIHYLERILQIEPDNAVIRQALRRFRGELEQQTAGPT